MLIEESECDAYRSTSLEIQGQVVEVGSKLRSLDLAANTFSCCAISLAALLLFPLESVSCPLPCYQNLRDIFLYLPDHPVFFFSHLYILEVLGEIFHVVNLHTIEYRGSELKLQRSKY